MVEFVHGGLEEVVAGDEVPEGKLTYRPTMIAVCVPRAPGTQILRLPTDPSGPNPPLSGSVETGRVVTIPMGRDWIF